MNIDFCIETLWKLAIFLHGRFEFKAVGDKWLHETNKEEEECTKPRKHTPTRQKPFKKGGICISEGSTHGALFLEKVFYGLQSKTTFADVKKIKWSKCSAPVKSKM